MSRVLGVDLGERRIGLALSDPTRTIGSPHSVLERVRARADDHDAILRVARLERADRIVVGLPLSLSGKHGPAARAALIEIEALRAAAGDEFTIEPFDERLTTVSAERSMAPARLTRAARRRVVDKVAAAVMLQSWLDRQVSQR